MSRWTFALPMHLGDGGASMLFGDAALMQRVRLVLSTRPGTLPWRPEFGCPMWDLAGQPASAANLAAIRWSIEAAIARWIPELEVAACELTIRQPTASTQDRFNPRLARSGIEAGLLHLGVDALLQIDLSLKTRSGVVRARLALEEDSR